VQAIPPKPVLYSVPAVVALGYAVFRFFPVRREVRALRLERDGEKDVGQKLELLRKKGYEILHDIIGNGFNLDHVLIGPAGIFTVETKTHSNVSCWRKARDYNPLGSGLSSCCFQRCL
jgi:hypothetical protein